MLCGNVDLDFDEFLQFDGKHKCNRHCLQLKSVNYPANNFGRFNYFYRTHWIWNNLPQSIFDGAVNLKKFKQALSDICFDALSGYWKAVNDLVLLVSKNWLLKLPMLLKLITETTF